MPDVEVVPGAAEELSGRRLRCAVAVVLHERAETMTLDELASALAAWGCATGPEARKAISDSLRWELHGGRAVRVGRGRCRSRGLARSTHGWMRAQVAGVLPPAKGDNEDAAAAHPPATSSR